MHIYQTSPFLITPIIRINCQLSSTVRRNMQLIQLIELSISETFQVFLPILLLHHSQLVIHTLISLVDHHIKHLILAIEIIDVGLSSQQRHRSQLPLRARLQELLMHEILKVINGRLLTILLCQQPLHVILVPECIPDQGV